MTWRTAQFERRPCPVLGIKPIMCLGMGSRISTRRIGPGRVASDLWLGRTTRPSADWPPTPVDAGYPLDNAATARP